MDLDEEDVNNGFPELIELAYSGKLTLDEYVNLIQNSVWARQYKFKFPNKIEWGKIREGIAGRINQLKEEQQKDSRFILAFQKKTRVYLTKRNGKRICLLTNFVKEIPYCFVETEKYT